jgi:gas vesicle protein
MAQAPDRIRDEIDMTRTDLARDVDALADRTLPNRVVGRKWANVKDKMHSVTETVMGTPRSAGEGMKSVGYKIQDASETVAGKAGEVASEVADTVKETPEMVRRQTQGNPIAVGMIAFGAGLLAASLIPATELEKQAGERIKEHSAELTEPLAESARQLKDDLKESVSDATEQVKQTAKDAAQTTVDEAKSSARTVADQGKQAVQ